MPIHSDWGEWLPADVAAAEPSGLDVWFLGCNGFAIKAADGTTLFVDPYLGTGEPPRSVRMIPVPFAPEDVRRADAVLATHEHSDHVHGASQAPILAGTDAEFYGPDAAIAAAREERFTRDWAVAEDDLHAVSESDTLTFGDVAVHVEGGNDPDAEHPVAYAVEYDGRTFFHGGDARPGEPFVAAGERHDVDLGALAFGAVGRKRRLDGEGTDVCHYYSDENQVIEAAGQLGATRLLPTHWDMWRNLTADPKALHHHAKSFEYPARLEIGEIGDRISV